MTPEQLDRLSARIVERARGLLAAPNNMDVRRDYMRAVFNIDRAAEAIVHLAGLQDPQTTPPTPGDKSREDPK